MHRVMERKHQFKSRQEVTVVSSRRKIPINILPCVVLCALSPFLILYGCEFGAGSLLLLCGGLGFLRQMSVLATMDA